MKSAQYWEERALAREAQSRLMADKTLRDKTFRAYARAQKQIQQDAEKIFRTFMREGEISAAQANKLLSKQSMPRKFIESRSKIGTTIK